eukprot:3465621-Rhodomonas_salina.1
MLKHVERPDGSREGEGRVVLVVPLVFHPLLRPEGVSTAQSIAEASHHTLCRTAHRLAPYPSSVPRFA